MPVESKLLEEAGFVEEKLELARDNYGNLIEGKSGYPKPVRTWRITLEQNNQAVEQHYFWLLDHLKNDQGFADVIKIEDIFAASEQSAFFGSAMQRLGAQQEKVSSFLAVIGKMIKDLFQLVRELRILDERLVFYEDSISDKATRESADITLKGIWIDLVEQGAKNPASVFGMARELQFTTLPDLFFSTHAKTAEDVENMVNELRFNQKVKEVLKRKLRTYIQWRESTHKEVKNRRIFTLRYLRQHFDVIKMYISWVKPYLRNIRRLETADKTKSPDLISAFENAVVEIELMARNLPRAHYYHQAIEYNKFVYGVVLMYIKYRAKPAMSYQQEYQRGPVHTGQFVLELRAYAWTQDDIDKYMKMKDKEDLKLLVSIDDSLKAAMEALGDELERYLQEAGEQVKKEPPKQPEPFTAAFKGIFDLFKNLSPRAGTGKEKKKVSKAIIQKEKDVAAKSAKNAAWQTYKNFKKKSGMLAW